MTTKKQFATVAPAVAMTAVSMVLTLAVVVMWLGASMPWPVALVVGLGLDGGWLATLAYERRLAAQGDHSAGVTAVGWCFGLVATGVLVAHALGEDAVGAWLAVAWLPLAAKALWVVHGLWERTALTPTALERIASIQQTARDDAAVARAGLRADAATETTRLDAVTTAGRKVAEAQADAADRLSQAWQKLDATRQGDGLPKALTSVTSGVTPESRTWDLPIWGPTEPLTAKPATTPPAPQPPPAIEAAPDPTQDDLDAVVAALLAEETPPVSYRKLAARFRQAGHSASEMELRAAWHRATADAEGA